MKKYIVEFIGTFFLVLTVVCAVNGSAGIMAPVAIGAVLMVMIFAGGHISGGHFNPAVTLAVFMRGKCSAADVPGYMIAQVLAGAAAALLGTHLFGMAPAEASTAMPESMGAAIGAELLGTFALAWVVLQTATTASNAGNSHYGLAIGFTVTAMAYALGGFGTGGCFNPAVAIGAALDGLASWGTAGLAIATDLAGGALAAILFKATYTSQGDDD